MKVNHQTKEANKTRRAKAEIPSIDALVLFLFQIVSKLSDGAALNSEERQRINKVKTATEKYKIGHVGIKEK